MTRLINKVAIVTGGAAGLGAAIVRRLKSEGAAVIVTDIQLDAGQRLADELGCLFLEHDVTDETQWENVVSHVEREYGALHVLVNNAGIEGDFDMADLESATLTEWRTVHRVNLEGIFLGCRAAVPTIRRAGGGAIINLSSTAGLVATPDFLAYGSSKAAVRHLTMSVALHCARNGSRVRCNSVHPGIVLTPMLYRIIEDLAKKRSVSAAQILREFKSEIPQGEFQDPDDVAHAVLFLASEEARRITGIQLVVDGGCMLGRG